MLKFSTYSAGLRQWCILKVSEPEVHRCGEFDSAFDQTAGTIGQLLVHSDIQAGTIGQQQK